MSNAETTFSEDAGGEDAGRLLALQDDLLLCALAHVAFDGWSLRTLEQAASDVGFSRADVVRAFPGGVDDLIYHFSRWADRHMLAEMAEADLTTMGMTAKIALAVRTRLSVGAPHREAVRRAAGYLALPHKAALSVRLTADTVDALWYAAGDRSADFSFYTRRATLAAVYGATVLAWLGDDSEDYAETWAFLDRRLANVGQFHKLRSQCSSRFEALFTASAATG